MPLYQATTRWIVRKEGENVWYTATAESAQRALLARLEQGASRSDDLQAYYFVAPEPAATPARLQVEKVEYEEPS